MAPQFIYTMRGLKRFHPPDREVLRGINLSFYPGAKIGVIGGNGSGKSSLLRIMAGEDDGYTGEARLTRCRSPPDNVETRRSDHSSAPVALSALAMASSSASLRFPSQPV